MLKNIRVADLKPGMRVVDPGIDWQARPYLYASDRFIDSEQTVLQILSQGYREAYIDLALSDEKVAKRYAGEVERLLSTAHPLAPALESGKAHNDERSARLKEELPRAARLHDAAVDHARRVILSVRQGACELHGAVAILTDIVDSLSRNPDALLCLSFMRQRASYTYSHCANVAVLLAAFALSEGMSGDSAVTFGLAGLFHDLGKALLPASLLNARRKLNRIELTLVKKHPILAYTVLQAAPALPSDVLLAALEHHERYDGSGYPRGVAGNAISLIGQLTGIADTYDATSSRRPFQGPLHPQQALGMMYQMRGMAFHPVLVDKFVRMVGIYPVGSIVELEDGHRGVVSAANPHNPAKPRIILALDPNGKAIPPHECNLAKEPIAPVARCLPTELSGIDPRVALGLRL